MGFDHGADGDRVVVVGVDGSDASWRATAYAVGLARRQDARLVAVHVLPVHTVAMLAGVSWMLADTDQAAAWAMRRRISAGLACMAEVGVLRWEFCVVTAGDAVAGLSRVAAERRADMVVVGASGRRHRLTGSVGARLLRAHRWPVLVVP